MSPAVRHLSAVAVSIMLTAENPLPLGLSGCSAKVEVEDPLPFAKPRHHGSGAGRDEALAKIRGAVSASCPTDTAFAGSR